MRERGRHQRKQQQRQDARRVEGWMEGEQAQHQQPMKEEEWKEEETGEEEGEEDSIMTRRAFTSFIVFSICVSSSFFRFVCLCRFDGYCFVWSFQHEFFVWFSSSSSSSSSPLATPTVFVLFLSLTLFLLSLPLFVGNAVCCSQTLARVLYLFPYLFLLCVLLMDDISVCMFLLSNHCAVSAAPRAPRASKTPSLLPSYKCIYTTCSPFYVSSSLVCSPLFLVVSLQAL